MLQVGLTEYIVEISCMNIQDQNDVAGQEMSPVTLKYKPLSLSLMSCVLFAVICSFEFCL